MLSRTADNPYSIARYMERAETAARLMEVAVPSAQLHRCEWDSLLRAIGTSEAFAAKYGDPVHRSIVSHLFLGRDNPSSAVSCITAAREKCADCAHRADHASVRCHQFRVWSCRA